MVLEADEDRSLEGKIRLLKEFKFQTTKFFTQQTFVFQIFSVLIVKKV